MGKATLTEDEYIEALNQQPQLRNEDDHRLGMVFVAVPEGSRGHGMSGYDFVGDDTNGIDIRVVATIDQLYTVDTWQRV